MAIPNAWAIDADSIRKNMADLDSLIHMVETNYAGFPIIQQKGYDREYQMMKADVCKQTSDGKIGIEQAVCETTFYTESTLRGDGE